MADVSVGQILVGCVFAMGIVTLTVSTVKYVLQRSTERERDPATQRRLAEQEMLRREQQAIEASIRSNQERERKQEIKKQHLQETLQRLGVESTTIGQGNVLGDGNEPNHSSTSNSRSLSPARNILPTASSTSNSTVRRRRAPQTEDQRIRAEQEHAYQQSLLQDKKRIELERKIQLQEELEEQRELEKATRLSKLLSMIPEEPDENAENVCTLSIRWPDGTSMKRRFPSETCLKYVLAFVEAQDRLETEHNLCLASNYPRKTFGATHADETLDALGLMPNAVLMVDIEE